MDHLLLMGAGGQIDRWVMGTRWVVGAGADLGRLIALQCFG